MKNTFVLLIAIIFMLYPRYAISQEEKSIIPGDRIRINFHENLQIEPIIGSVVSMNSDSIVLMHRNVASSFSLFYTSKIEKSVGQETSFIKSTLIWSSVGALLGLFAHETVLSDTKLDLVAKAATFGAIAGLIAGANRSDKWEEIPIEDIRFRNRLIGFQGNKIILSIPLGH